MKKIYWRLCLDTGMVSDEFGHLPKYREVTGTPRGLNGPTWALVEEIGEGQEEGRPMSVLKPMDLG